MDAATQLELLRLIRLLTLHYATASLSMKPTVLSGTRTFCPNAQMLRG